MNITHTQPGQEYIPLGHIVSRITSSEYQSNFDTPYPDYDRIIYHLNYLLCDQAERLNADIIGNYKLHIGERFYGASAIAYQLSTEAANGS